MTPWSPQQVRQIGKPRGSQRAPKYPTIKDHWRRRNEHEGQDVCRREILQTQGSKVSSGDNKAQESLSELDVKLPGKR